MKDWIRIGQFVALVIMVILFAIGYNRDGILSAIPLWILSVICNEASDC